MTTQKYFGSVQKFDGDKKVKIEEKEIDKKQYESGVAFMGDQFFLQVDFTDTGHIEKIHSEDLEHWKSFFSRMVTTDKAPKDDSEKTNKTNGYKTADRFIKSLTPKQVKLFQECFTFKDSDGNPLFTSMNLVPTKQKWNSDEKQFFEFDEISIATYKDKTDAKLAESEDKDSNGTNNYEYYNAITRNGVNNVLSARHSKIQSEWSNYVDFINKEIKKEKDLENFS